MVKFTKQKAEQSSHPAASFGSRQALIFRKGFPGLSGAVCFCASRKIPVFLCSGRLWFGVEQQFDFYFGEDTAISNNDYFINEQIRDREVRVIGADGEQLGVMGSRDALKLAEEAGLDLVKIAPTAKPPVCRIVDYGKYKYEQTRRSKEARKKQRVIEVKEIRLTPNIDTNDLKTKSNAARKFLERGDRVKVTLRFRGREMAHMTAGRHILDDFAANLEDIATVEKQPKVEGRTMTMQLTGKK